MDIEDWWPLRLQQIEAIFSHYHFRRTRNHGPFSALPSRVFNIGDYIEVCFTGDPPTFDETKGWHVGSCCVRQPGGGSGVVYVPSLDAHLGATVWKQLTELSPRPIGQLLASTTQLDNLIGAMRALDMHSLPEGVPVQKADSPSQILSQLENLKPVEEIPLGEASAPDDALLDYPKAWLSDEKPADGARRGLDLAKVRPAQLADWRAKRAATRAGDVLDCATQAERRARYASALDTFFTEEP